MDVWIETLPKAKKGPHRGKKRYKVRARGFTGANARKQTLSRTFTAKSAAEMYKENLVAGCLNPEKMTVSEVAARFLTYDCAEKDEDTKADYEAIISNHILRYVGDSQVIQLKKIEIEEMLRRIRVEPLNRPGLVKKKPAGPRVADKTLMVLKVLIERAEGDQVILGSEPNIRSIRKIKPLNPEGRGKVALNLAESRRLLDAAVHPYKDPIFMALNTGMRIGEILGLDWADVSLRNRTITPVRQCTKGKIKSKLKNRHSYRVIPINDALLPRLRNMQLRADLSNWIFPGKGDMPLSGQALGRQGIRDAASIAGLTPDICEKIPVDSRLRFHDLRRTANTMLVEQYVPEVIIRRLLGHADNSMTGYYSGIGFEAKLEAMNKICVPYEIEDNVAQIRSSLNSSLLAASE